MTLAGQNVTSITVQPDSAAILTATRRQRHRRRHVLEHGVADAQRHGAAGAEPDRLDRLVERQPDRVQLPVEAVRLGRQQLRQHRRRDLQRDHPEQRVCRLDAARHRDRQQRQRLRQRHLGSLRGRRRQPTSRARRPPPCSSSAPVNTALPTISGTAQQGQNLFARPARGAAARPATATSGSAATRPATTAPHRRRDLQRDHPEQRLRRLDPPRHRHRQQRQRLRQRHLGSVAVVAGTDDDGCRPEHGVADAQRHGAAGAEPVASTGSWSGSPTGYSYQWKRCDSAGNNCANIGGEIFSGITLSSAVRRLDPARHRHRHQQQRLGQRHLGSLRARRRARLHARRLNTALPTISGTAQQGQNLYGVDRVVERQPDRVQLPVEALRLGRQQLRQHRRRDLQRDHPEQRLRRLDPPRHRHREQRSGSGSATSAPSAVVAGLGSAAGEHGVADDQRHRAAGAEPVRRRPGRGAAARPATATSGSAATRPATTAPTSAARSSAGSR